LTKNFNLLSLGLHKRCPDPHPDPHPDLLVKGADPRILIRTKMSRIRNTGLLIRIQHFSLNIKPDPDPIWIQSFDDQKLNKIDSSETTI
jgi:hypothetical protein